MLISIDERRRMLKLIHKILVTHLEFMTERLEEYKILHASDSWNIAVGRAIEEISNKYPTSYDDAVIIYEEWAMGLLTECRPNETMLRKYAEYTGSPDNFREWARKYRTDNKMRENMQGVESFKLKPFNQYNCDMDYVYKLKGENSNGN